MSNTRSKSSEEKTILSQSNSASLLQRSELKTSPLPIIYIIGEANHYTFENQIFRENLRKIARSKDCNFYLGVEGYTYKKNNKNCSNGIENNMIFSYVTLVTTYIMMNPAQPYSNDKQRWVNNNFIKEILKFYQNSMPECFIMQQSSSRNSSMRCNLANVRMVAEKKLSIYGSSYQNFITEMPGESILSHLDGFSKSYHDLWIEEYSDYVLKDIPKALKVLAEIIYALREAILNETPDLASHQALTKTMLQNIFSNKHSFKNDVYYIGSELLDLFFIDLRNFAWINNIIDINNKANAKNLPAVYIVGDNHIQDLKEKLRKQRTTHQLLVFSSHDVNQSSIFLTENSNLVPQKEIEQIEQKLQECENFFEGHINKTIVSYLFQTPFNFKKKKSIAPEIQKEYGASELESPKFSY